MGFIIVLAKTAQAKSTLDIWHLSYIIYSVSSNISACFARLHSRFTSSNRSARPPTNTHTHTPVSRSCAACFLPLTPGLLELIDQVPEELWSARLGLALLHERAKGPKSLFTPYVNLLPAVHRGVPLFFAPVAVAALQYPPAVEQLKRRSRFLVHFAAGPLTASTSAPHGERDETRRDAMRCDAMREGGREDSDIGGRGQARACAWTHALGTVCLERVVMEPCAWSGR